MCDHDAEGRAQFRKELRLATTAARKDVLDGIEKTMARMKPAGDGRPRLYVLRDVVIERDPELVENKLPIGLAEEIGGYIWAPPTEGRAPKEEPLKVNDHSCDTMRYVVAHLDLGGRRTIRYFGT